MASTAPILEPQPLRVAIIGAGVSGMTTAKACLESGLLVDVFEHQTSLGGVWRFRTDVEAHIGSVMHCTIVNSSKEMTAFSDFPVPEEFPNFMHNRLMIEYLELYAKSFDFEKLVKFGHSVVNISQSSQAGYFVEFRTSNVADIQRKHYDAVAVCTGHNHTPRWPKPIEGIENFKGQILHSHDVRFTDDFRHKRVVVVGVGNSGGDIAADLAPICRQVWLSSRRTGTWLIRRAGLNGYPVDTQSQRRVVEGALRLLPMQCRSRLVEFLQQKLIGHRLLGLKPNSTRFFSQHVMVNDLIPTAIHLGQIKMRGNIARFVHNGVVFEGDTLTTECDAVIFATGYELSLPFVPPELVQWNPNGALSLYRHVFDPLQPCPERLAFIGLTQPIGSLPPIAEIQARWFVNLLVGGCKPLPSRSRMQKEIQRRKHTIVRRYGQHNEERYTFQADWLPYMDSIAREAAVAPRIWRYALKDPPLWWALLTKPAISAQFRLDGPHAKFEQARRLILDVHKRVKRPYTA